MFSPLKQAQISGNIMKPISDNGPQEDD